MIRSSLVLIYLFAMTYSLGYAQSDVNKPNLKIPLEANFSYQVTVEYGGATIFPPPDDFDEYHTDAHNGYYAIDLDNPPEKEDVAVLAAANGTVTFAGGDPKTGFGYYVKINHGNKYETLYGHLKELPTVSGTVIQGQQIGIMGTTGNSTGTHLHFVLKYDGKCISTEPKAKPEPLSGKLNIQKGQFLKSDNYGPTGTNLISWNFDEYTEGWSQRKGTAIDKGINAALGGNWIIDPGVDPGVVSPILTAVDASKYKTVEIRMAAKGGGEEETGEVFFITNLDEPFSENKKVGLIEKIKRDGNQYVYKVPMSTNEFWTGRIFQVRIDPIKNGNPSAEDDLIFVDYIRFTEEELFPTLTLTPLVNTVEPGGVLPFQVTLTNNSSHNYGWIVGYGKDSAVLDWVVTVVLNELGANETISSIWNYRVPWWIGPGTYTFTVTFHDFRHPLDMPQIAEASFQYTVVGIAAAENAAPALYHGDTPRLQIVSGDRFKVINDKAALYALLFPDPAEVLDSPQPVPQETTLYQNIPNPFNPETWLPYQLAEAADVTIDIYALQGHLIRSLSLGHKPAGFYLNRDKAAYWDGRNQTGERVGSGVYFYHLTAGSFRATKKMVIQK